MVARDVPSGWSEVKFSRWGNGFMELAFLLHTYFSQDKKTKPDNSVEVSSERGRGKAGNIYLGVYLKLSLVDWGTVSSS